MISFCSFNYIADFFPRRTLGVSTRYFLPLFALLPIIVSVKLKILDRFREKYDDYAVIFIIGFMATLILAFATKYY